VPPGSFICSAAMASTKTTQSVLTCRSSWEALRLTRLSLSTALNANIGDIEISEGRTGSEGRIRGSAGDRASAVGRRNRRQHRQHWLRSIPPGTEDGDKVRTQAFVDQEFRACAGSSKGRVYGPIGRSGRRDDFVPVDSLFGRHHRPFMDRRPPQRSNVYRHPGQSCGTFHWMLEIQHFVPEPGPGIRDLPIQLREFRGPTQQLTGFT
jgi:hypothetical protein